MKFSLIAWACCPSMLIRGNSTTTLVRYLCFRHRDYSELKCCCLSVVKGEHTETDTIVFKLQKECTRVKGTKDTDPEEVKYENSRGIFFLTCSLRGLSILSL